MKAIIFLAILGLALAGLRGEKKKIPHWMPHHPIDHHVNHHASKTSGHGHAHGNSNSENSEELFGFLGTLLGDIKGTIETIKDNIAARANHTASTQSHIAGVASKKIPHLLPHSKASAGKTSSHGSSKSDNSEELFSLVGAIQDGVANVIQDGTNAVTSHLQNRAVTVSDRLEKTAETVCNKTQGAFCNFTENRAETVSNRLQQRASTLDPIINATGTDIAYATKHLNTTQITDDINDGVNIAETGLKTAGDVMKIVSKGISAAGLAFVETSNLKTDIQNTIEAIKDNIQARRNDTNVTDDGAVKSDIQQTIATIKSNAQARRQNFTNHLTQAVESITPAEASQIGNDIASGVGTGLKLANGALQDVNDGLGIVNKVIP